MMNRLFALFCVTATLTPLTFAHAQVSAVPSAMNFQGRLAKPDGTPVANGTHNLLISVYSSLSGGTLLWQKSITGVAVKNGVFATRLDFSSGYQNSATQSTLFGASTVFLDISVDGGASLVPRQQFLTVAYAMKADSVKDGAITNASIANGSITSAKLASGAITSASLNPLAWLLGGNSGVTSGFLGTTDNNPLELRVNNRRAMRYVYAENTIDPNNKYRSMNVLGGSEINLIGAGVVGATIAGGGLDNFTGTDQPNHVTANFGTIGGGYSNIASGGYAATVGGGNYNTASGSSATVGGGYSNIAPGGYATVGGGIFNTASGVSATVGGGYVNTASGDYSFAAGSNAKAKHSGAFVWADSGNADFLSTTINQFNVRASGGVRLFTNSALTSGVTLLAGDSSWNSVSDRNAKTNFHSVDGLEVLERLCAMPVTTWHYKANTDIRHMGVMAQDFHAAFGGLGMDDKHISTVDADGVAFAAIQGLNRKLEAKVQTLEARLAAIEKIFREKK
ncbi:MAG: tail fiber domain-containing protein [Chthonomonadaceae bacterium]|nr:tail fiber domain-containing protein [Chthonomonadaceae bacterium]